MLADDETCPSFVCPIYFIFRILLLGTTAAVGMAETEVVSPPPVPLEEPVWKDAPEKREGKPERPRRELEDIPEMTVEEAHKALNALPKVNKKNRWYTQFQYKTKCTVFGLRVECPGRR